MYDKSKQYFSNIFRVGAESAMIMHRFLEKAEILIIIFSQKGINRRLIQAQ